EALRHSRSGLISLDAMREAGFSCSIYGPVRGWDAKRVPARAQETRSTVAEYAAVAASDALQDAGLQVEHLDAARTGVIVGTAFGGINELSRMHRLLQGGEKSRAGEVGVAKAINSGTACNLAATLGLRGRAYSVSTSFAAGPDNIGHAYEQIKHGMMDVALCGAAEEDCWLQIGAYFDNWGGLPSDYNDRPAEACRPYDLHRQGAVLSAGAGILLIESLDHARRRNARIHAEIVGYGSANDGADMFRPTGQGLTRAIRQAMTEASSHGVRRLDYINTHGTGTPLGDRVEAEVLRDVVGDGPMISSTKGLSGHAMGACGAIEAVYTLRMLDAGFVAPTVNLQNVAVECEGLRHVRAVVEQSIETAMTFSVGLGGFNSSLVFSKLAVE
ncbi:MAG TPA: beta-ketoacyl-[acyl-carrier-protein] synthase family protein, partial [Thermoguttaceae bacterium]|nr:beta-ketoacyl-[acyl-carrier-protein] synthase family protein [Thermoguttaceae bacterium]